ncbi:MAG: peptide deformylase [Bacteroidales bacterium]|nr:peptide deformylase [Bacteroidales bacterium]
MNVLSYPHPALRVKARPVTTLDAAVIQAGREMLELMYKQEGLGLAAQQVGLDYQILVINFQGDPACPEQEVVAINPVILESKGSEKGREGCLSFPGLYQDIRRAKMVRVQYYDLTGKPFEMTCTGLPARIWQHEIDHLNGVLFIDKMGPLARMGSKKAIEDFVTSFRKKQEKGDIPPDVEMKL